MAWLCVCLTPIQRMECEFANGGVDNFAKQKNGKTSVISVEAVEEDVATCIMINAKYTDGYGVIANYFNIKTGRIFLDNLPLFAGFEYVM